VLYLGLPRDSVVVEAYRHLVEDELDDATALAATARAGELGDGDAAHRPQDSEAVQPWMARWSRDTVWIH
jgi:hypothetical protein